MKKNVLIRIGIIISASLAILSAGNLEIIKYNEKGLCFKTGKKLNDDEMRIKVIKSLLNIEIKSNEWHKSHTSRIVVIKKSLTESEIIQSIKSSSLQSLAKNNSIEINNKNDIESIPPIILNNKFTIINYSIQGGWFNIFPGDEIKKSDKKNQILFHQKKMALNIAFTRKFQALEITSTK